MFKIIREFFWRLFRPSFWYQGGETSLVWDQALTEFMDEGKPVQNIDNFTCVIGGVTIWLGNYPYSYGNIYGDGNTLPLGRTRIKLKDYITAAKIRRRE